MNINDCIKKSTLWFKKSQQDKKINDLLNFIY